jgi:hypothetical protein
MEEDSGGGGSDDEFIITGCKTNQSFGELVIPDGTVQYMWLIPFGPHEKLPDLGFLKIHCVQVN